MSVETVSIKGLDKAAVLAALYNAACPQGFGFLHYDPFPMAVEEAQEMLAEMFAAKDHSNIYYPKPDAVLIDHIKGRVLKIGFSIDSDDLCVGLYDHANGEGAAAFVIEQLKRHGQVWNAAIQELHEHGVRAAVMFENI